MLLWIAFRPLSGARHNVYLPFGRKIQAAVIFLCSMLCTEDKERKSNLCFMYFFLDEKVPKNQGKTMLLPALPDTNPCGKVNRNGTG